MKKILLIYALLFSAGIFAQNWGEQILTQPNVGNNSFGYAIAMDNEYAVIGAPSENQFTGSVHVYKRDANGSWNHIQRIEAYVGQAIDENFGMSVAIQGDYIFIGTPSDRLNEELFQSPAGSVMIYKNNGADNFVGHQRLRAPDASHGDNFGTSLDIDGDFLVVGNPFEDQDENGLNTISAAGSAYIFKKDIDDTWGFIQKIVPSHRARSNFFGELVAIDGNFIIASSRSNTDAANANPVGGEGSVFVFEKDNGLNTWSEVQKLKPLNRLGYSGFGFRDMDIVDDYIAIGADNVDASDNGTWYEGYVYVFKRDGLLNTWSENQIVKYPGGSNFGQGISMDNDYLLISDPYRSINSVYAAGKSYLYKRTGNNNDLYELKENIVTSEIQASNFVGGGSVDGFDARQASVINNNHFALGAASFDINDGGVNYLTAGAAFFSGNINNILPEDITWTGDESNDWNDPLNWFPNTVPQSTNDVILENVANTPNITNGQNHTINNLTTFENLNIETNASLTVQGNVDQRAQITVNSAVDSNGSLIVNGNQTNPNPSNTTYNRYVSGNGNSWHLISSPVSNADIDNFAANEPLTNGQGNNRGLSWYNNVNQNWEYYQAGAVGSGNFPNGKGYAINTSANTTLEFTGLLNASILENYPITVNGNGWNLVGNPYTSFLHANTNANATNFLTTNVGQLDPVAANIYVWNPALSAYETIGNGDEAKYLAPGQAFFIKSKAGGGNINVTKSMQTHRGENLFLKSAPIQKIVLETSGNEEVSRTSIAFKEGMTNGLDVSYDAAVFSGVKTDFSTYTQLLQNYENTKFAVQYLPKLNDDTVVIPVGILLDKEKELNIKLKESNIESDYKIYLEDRLLNEFTELSLENSYTFNHDLQVNGLGRFYIHLQQKNALSIDTFNNNTIQAYKVNHSTLRVNGVQNGKLSLYDITGKQIVNNLTIKQINQNFSFPNLTRGVYILHITDNKGGKFIKKVIF